MNTTLKYILFLFITLLISCKKETIETPPKTTEGIHLVTKSQFKASQMVLGTPTYSTFNSTVKASGRLDVPPKNKAIISTFVGGYVKISSLLVGDRVAKEQAVLTIENTEFIDLQKEYLEVAEQMEYLKSEYTRQKTLYSENISSEKNFLKAESDFKRTQAIYKSLKEKLLLLNLNPKQVEQGKIVSTITLYAPISGTVSVMNAQNGMYMAPSTTILELVDTNELHIELSVFEKDILKVKENQKIEFQVPEASTTTFDGTVHLIGNTIEGNDRVINVHGHLDSKVKQQLLKGMFAEAQIIVGSKKGWAIPNEALVSENNKSYIYQLVKEDQNSYSFKKVWVTLGEKNEKQTEIIPNSKFDPKAKIVLKGAYDITE